MVVEEYLSTFEVILYSILRFWPSWIAIAATLIGGYFIKDRLGMIGRLYGSKIGLTGAGIVFFWIFTALFADFIAVMEPLDQAVAMKKAIPGSVDPESGVAFLWGGDNLARDVFSRIVYGSRVVLIIAPAATLIAYMVGITLGLPSGYFTGKIDAVLSFLANLVLAFPVILLFYLLVTPEIRQPVFYDLFELQIPASVALALWVVAILLLTILISWYFRQENRLNADRSILMIAVTSAIGFGALLGVIYYFTLEGGVKFDVLLDVDLPWSIPIAMAALFFLFPILFLCVLWFTKYEKNKTRLTTYIAVTAIIGFWLYIGLVFNSPVGPISLEPNELNVFAAVVFASSPGVFRIVRGLTMDIKTRDYVAAAQTRGERTWYIMLWEILPNARGPLIVDACLRIGYTTILLGTLGFFGLGLEPESPDWGSMINHGRSFVRLASTAHMSLFPALALLTLVLGLNLLADGLREESLKD